MTRLRRGRRLLVALTALAIASSVAVTHRSGRAELEALSDTQLATEYVVLRWSAPGDDGLSGRATRYDLRYSTYNITSGDTLGWWNSASRVNLFFKTPASPGMPDSVRIIGLTAGLRYYAMLRTCDEVPNWSPYSNLAVILATDLQAPSAVTNLRVR